MSNYLVRDAREDTDADILADFMTLQAMETEGKTLQHDIIAQGVRGLFNRPGCGKYYVACSSDKGNIVGMIMIHFEMNLSLGGMIHWINSVYVHPEHR